MSNTTWREDWHPVTNTEAHQITSYTSSPGVVYPHPITALPSPIQKLPGLYEAYISAYQSTYKSPEAVSIQGEIVAARTGEGTGKGYVYLFGVSSTGIYFNGDYKPPDGHYFDPAQGVPVDKLFGKIQRNEKKE